MTGQGAPCPAATAGPPPRPLGLRRAPTPTPPPGTRGRRGTPWGAAAAASRPVSVQPATSPWSATPFDPPAERAFEALDISPLRGQAGTAAGVGHIRLASLLRSTGTKTVGPSRSTRPPSALVRDDGPLSETWPSRWVRGGRAARGATAGRGTAPPSGMPGGGATTRQGDRG